MVHDSPTPLIRDPQFQRIALAISLLLAILAGGAIYWGSSQQDTDPIEDDAPAVARNWKLEEIPFDGAAAYQWIKDLCALGSRTSGTLGMRKQQQMLTEHFRSLGGKVRLQSWDIRHPMTGERTTLSNLIVEWHPERKERILLATHYDTRPFADQDPVNKKALFLGANDGASGVAVLCELGRHMPKLQSKYGVDFVLFDAEELVYEEIQQQIEAEAGDRLTWYFLGSKYFAKDYIANPPEHRYLQGALLDMVGDANLEIYYEQNSLSWADTRPILQGIWGTARRLGVREFIARKGHDVSDDHLAIRNDAGIPMCDIIDFDYPTEAAFRARRTYWHTTEDKPENCSALSLAKVGWVMLEWLKTVKVEEGVRRAK